MRKGFTLLELLVVVVIIGILATLGIRGYLQARMNSVVRVSNALAIKVGDGLNAYELAHGGPGSLSGYYSFSCGGWDHPLNGLISSGDLVLPKFPTRDFRGCWIAEWGSPNHWSIYICYIRPNFFPAVVPGVVYNTDQCLFFYIPREHRNVKLPSLHPRQWARGGSNEPALANFPRGYRWTI